VEDQKRIKQQISYGYFVDEDGLYYYSEKDGEVYEIFDINGVATATIDFNKIEVLFLAYIYDDNKRKKN
jgi:hypothetical protein